MSNLSSDSGSSVPSVLARTYLSSSNGKKIRFVPALTVPVELLEIFTVYSFLNTIEELVRSTDSTFRFGSNAKRFSSLSVFFVSVNSNDKSFS